MKATSMKTLTISLSPQQIGRIQRAVETGAYASNSEVLRDALRLWEQREELRAFELEQLKTAYQEGMASGEGRIRSAEALLKSFRMEVSKGG